MAEAERLAAESRSLGQALGDPDADRIWIAQTIAIQAEHDPGEELLNAVATLAESSLRPYDDRIALLLYGSAPLGPVSGALGRLTARLGRHSQAVAALERALETTEAISAQLWAEHARAELRAALLSRGAPDDGAHAAALAPSDYRPHSA
ncbi:MAG TPA: hypothetical protein VI300_26740 [Solirubrobacter sp.]